MRCESCRTRHLVALQPMRQWALSFPYPLRFTRRFAPHPSGQLKLFNALLLSVCQPPGRDVVIDSHDVPNLRHVRSDFVLLLVGIRQTRYVLVCPEFVFGDKERHRSQPHTMRKDLDSALVQR